MALFLRRRPGLVLAVALVVAALPAAARADHAWGCYHWSSGGNGISLNVGDNVSSVWDPYLDEALQDWNQSTVVNLTEVAGGTRPRNCRPTSGRIEACSERYGNNGWLGIAQIWVSGCHITQATTKVNDYYFNQAQYNTPAWRRLVMCQEIAHDFGLDHQDENFNNANLGSCMDYTSDPDGPPSNEHPNAHDFEQLEIIYNHADAALAAGPIAPNEDLNSPASWGVLVRTIAGGRVQVFERDLGRGVRMLTRVTWANLEQDRE